MTRHPFPSKTLSEQIYLHRHCGVLLLKRGYVQVEIIAKKWKQCTAGRFLEGSTANSSFLIDTERKSLVTQLSKNVGNVPKQKQNLNNWLSKRNAIKQAS